MHGHFVHGFETLRLNLWVAKASNRRMNLHELKSDLFASFLDLKNGGGAFHARMLPMKNRNSS
jgi:hypothetical protein